MKRAGLPILSGTVMAVSCALLASCSCLAGVSDEQPSRWPGADLFTGGQIRQIRVELDRAAAENLRHKPRDYVRATIVESGNTYSNVGVHLKGAESFRPLNDKPSLTLDFSKFAKGQKFHGLRKIHLNNSVEDPSYVNEIIGSEMFRAAGVPTPRATRALVVINGRARGLYVLKEGFTEDFLSCHFKRINDQLYEPENGSDVDGRLKRNSVFTEPGSGEALKALADAALEPDVSRRWQRLNAALDMDRFLTFMAIEIMLGHRDGYSLARNNFRVYHDLDHDKMMFFPHGMDQLLGSVELSWQPSLGGLVARAVMQLPEGRERYAERFHWLLTNSFDVALMSNRVNRLVEQLRPVLSRGEWTEVRDAATTVQERLAQRKVSLVLQLNSKRAEPLQFASGAESLHGWEVGELAAEGKMEEAKSPDGFPALYVVARGETAASWRTTALVPRGRYRFEGRVRIASVQPLPYGVHHGAGLRIRGAKRQTGSLTGDSAWQLLAADFQVEQSVEEVGFVCELRARRGEAWFDLGSLRVLKTGDL